MVSHPLFQKVHQKLDPFSRPKSGPHFFFWSIFWPRNGGHILIQKVDPVFSRNSFYVLPKMNFRIRGWIENGSKLGPDTDRRMEAKKCSQTILKSTSKPHPNKPLQQGFWGRRAWLRSGVPNGLQLRANSGVVWQINCVRCRGAPYECKLGFWSGHCLAELWQTPASFLHFFGKKC